MEIIQIFMFQTPLKSEQNGQHLFPTQHHSRVRGPERNNSGVTGVVEKFDPERNLWTKMRDLLVAKSGLAAVTVERRQLGEAAQRSYGSARREELMVRDRARGLERTDQANPQCVLSPPQIDTTA